MSGVCPKCGSENPPGASFCGQCGFLLGSAPGGPALERLTPPGGPPPARGDSTQPVTPARPADPGADGFPDGTEGQGIWAGASGAGSPAGPYQPGGAAPGAADTGGAYPVPGAYQPPQMTAPPAPKKPDNTMKVILWVVGGCCALSVLIFAGLLGLGFYLNKQEAQTNTSTNGTVPVDNGTIEFEDTAPNGMDPGADGVEMTGLEQVYGIAEAVTAADQAEVTDWAIAQQLGELYQPQDALVYACAAGNAPVVKFLASDPAVDINGISPAYGASALHSASYNNFIDCIAILIANGADYNLNAGGDQGTPLHQAALGNAVDSARLLIACGAVLEARNDLGITPLHDAANSNAADVASLLIANGAGVDIPTGQEGNTALMLAANQGNVEVGRVLIESGANLNYQEPQFGLTALHTAAYVGSADFVRLLLDSGANPYLRANDGQTPQQMAEANGHSAVAEMLN